MAYSDKPTGANADYYISGRGQALYNLKFPATVEPPKGTPAWWSNEGIIDAWMGKSSRTGSEATFTDADGKPLAIRLGVPDPRTGVIPRGPFDGGAGNTSPPNMTPAGPITIPRWVTDYWSAYLLARQDPVTAKARRAEGAKWTPYYQQGLADGLAGASPKDPSGFVPTPAQLAEVQGIIGSGSSPQVGIIRPAPAYVPRGNGGGGVYIPPPGPPGALSTREIYGRLRNRDVPIFDLFVKDGLRSHLIRGGRVMIGDAPNEGFGYGGTPGAWSQASGGINPASFGLDPNIGVVAFDGRKLRPLDAYTLGQIFGPNWQAIVKAA